MNKIYFFKTHEDAETGVFVAAPTWKEAREEATKTEIFDDYNFIEITGHLHREDKKVFYSEKCGELDARDLISAGCSSFHWAESECEKCGTISTLNPVDGKMICRYCEEETEENI